MPPAVTILCDREVVKECITARCSSELEGEVFMSRWALGVTMPVLWATMDMAANQKRGDNPLLWQNCASRPPLTFGKARKALSRKKLVFHGGSGSGCLSASECTCPLGGPYLQVGTQEVMKEVAKNIWRAYRRWRSQSCSLGHATS